jgi:feruloyl esterase
MEAQRFPDDFDGIIAGAPANDWVGLSLGHIWQRNALARSGFTLAKMNALNAAALGAVDGLDGVTDGVINDPTKVAFDPAAMACPAGVDDASCLTPSQVEAAREIYAGPGVNIFPGMYLGTESGWNFAMNDGGLGPGLYQYMVYQDTTWDMSTLSTPQDYAKAKADAASAAATISSIDPNLDTFRGRGGKLIMYHGLSDQAIAAKSSEIYYRSVVSRVGGLEETMQFTRLFMAPGMRHCGGGNGADTFDALTALEDWVEKGTAPTQLIASKGGPGGLGLTMSSGTGEVTRPLCPYPQVAQYKGSGSTDSAGNFVCTAP